MVSQVAKTCEILFLEGRDDDVYAIFETARLEDELFQKKNNSIQFGFEDFEWWLV